MYKKFLIIFSIIIVFFLFLKKKENFDTKDDRKKIDFDIIVDLNKINNKNKHISGFGSYVSQNVYRLN